MNCIHIAGRPMPEARMSSGSAPPRWRARSPAHWALQHGGYPADEPRQPNGGARCRRAPAAPVKPGRRHSMSIWYSPRAQMLLLVNHSSGACMVNISMRWWPSWRRAASRSLGRGDTGRANCRESPVWKAIEAGQRGTPLPAAVLQRRRLPPAGNPARRVRFAAHRGGHGGNRLGCRRLHQAVVLATTRSGNDRTDAREAASMRLPSSWFSLPLPPRAAALSLCGLRLRAPPPGASGRPAVQHLLVVTVQQRTL